MSRFRSSSLKLTVAAVLSAAVILQLAVLSAASSRSLSAATGSCPVTPDIKAEDIPSSCQSRTASDVCGACLNTLIDKVRSQIPPSIACEDYPKCLDVLRSKVVQFASKVNIVAALSCNLDTVSKQIADKVQCTGTKPTPAQIKTELQSAAGGMLG